MFKYLFKLQFPVKGKKVKYLRRPATVSVTNAAANHCSKPSKLYNWEEWEGVRQEKDREPGDLKPEINH